MVSTKRMFYLDLEVMIAMVLTNLVSRIPIF